MAQGTWAVRLRAFLRHARHGDVRRLQGERGHAQAQKESEGGMKSEIDKKVEKVFWWTLFAIVALCACLLARVRGGCQ